MKRRFQSMDTTKSNDVLQTNLHKAIHLQDLVSVRALILNRSDPCIQDELGNTVLHEICLLGYSKLLRPLLARPTTEEIRRHHPEEIAYCIDRQKLCLELPNNNGETPLHIAARLNDTGLAKKLLKYGANINSQSPIYRWTALHIAVMYDFEPMVQLLLKWQPDITAQTRSGLSVLDMADPGNHFMILILTRAGAAFHLRKKRHLFWDSYETESEDEDIDDNVDDIIRS